VVQGLFKLARVFGSLVGKDGLSGMNLVQGDGVLLDNFDGHRLGSRKVPDLLALGLCLLKGAGNRRGIDILLGLAKVEAL
jgi:hypothetical protein